MRSDFCVQLSIQRMLEVILNKRYFTSRLLTRGVIRRCKERIEIFKSGLVKNTQTDQGLCRCNGEAASFEEPGLSFGGRN